MALRESIMVWDVVNPWWLALVLGIVVVITARLVKAHVLSMPILLISVVLILALSAYLLWRSFGYEHTYLLVWLVGVAVAVAWNYFVLHSPRGVFYVHNKKRFIFPGSWLPFVSLLLLAVLYYSTRTLQVMNHTWLTENYVVWAICCLYGVLGGLLVGYFMESLRAQKERPIGSKYYPPVTWTVAK